MKKIKIGLMPLYIALYDKGRRCPSRDVLEPFYDELAGMYEEKGFDVVKVPFCRVESEFDDAIAKFEAEKADCIVTIHMAYSPSLESLKSFLKTDLPIVICDTTVTYSFDPMQDPIHLDYCHGIHGVMDMCCMFRQNGKKYAIAAGHYKESDVVDRTMGLVRAAVSAKALKGIKVGSIGGSFDGMGDFLVNKEILMKNFGVEAKYAQPEELEEIKANLTDADIKDIEEDYAKLFKNYNEFGKEDLMPTLKASAVTRKWIKNNGLDAFSVNFLKVGTGSGLDSMPFAEACAELSKGVGYAGEGDVLTASLVAAFMKGYPTENVSFMEFFCPDWKGERIFINHMGEMNIAAAEAQPVLIRNNFRYADGVTHTFNPSAEYKPGKFAYINLCRDENGFKFVTSAMEMLYTEEDAFKELVRGWLKPASMPIAKFLEENSRHGATHHSVLVYGATTREIEYFADLLGIRCEVIE